MVKENENQFLAILYGGFIKTLYQPIVSLENGSVLGYEALSRVRLPSCELNIEQLFAIASEAKKLWEFEKLCRTQALKNAAAKPREAKLFINVDPNVIYDPELKSGFTCEILKEYGLNPKDIIFEVTEKNAIIKMEAFTAAIQHYQQQNFKIAVDDFGSGYSGLERTCFFSPDYLKIDMTLVRDIHEDAFKRSVVKSIVKFCKEMEISVIGEGIETEAELRTLIRLGVDYGQGYFLARPSEQFQDIRYDVNLSIKETKNKLMAPGYPSSLFGRITSICQEKVTVPVEKRAVEVYEMMQRDETITEICAVNDHRRVCGILTREYLFKQFSGQFGYNLSARKTAGNLMTRDFLAVDSTATIDDVAILAMKRTAATVYDAVVVTEGNQYLGVVSVKDLLMTAVNMQVKRASEASPLTGLPGNAAVQGMICDILKEKKSFSIIYLDIDNFKAYNDAYGFSNGDLMIKAVAEAMKESCQEEDFKGHIGGDDFVIISRDSDVKTMCEKIIDAFNKKIKSLYSREDWERGYIVSKNRNGFIENFPMATISIAVVTNHLQTFAGLEELSKAIAQAKKKSKQVKGNSIIIS